MKSLILAEKPSVGRDIANALNLQQKSNGYIEGKQYIVTWALGHLVTNATPEQYNPLYKEWNLEDLPIIPKKMKTVVISKTNRQFKVVKSLILDKNVKEIIIATDAGREGELVARLILDKVGNKKPIKRLWISSVTKKAIQEGFKQLKNGNAYQNLYKAALARSEADWIVGINATRALTTKYDAQLSLGRVQTPTIQLVKSRQDEINYFKPEKYYTLSINVDGYDLNLNQQKRYKDKKELELIEHEIKHQEGKILEVKGKNKKSYAQPLFNLTDLQQEAYKRYKMGPKETLNTLQHLYERHKLVTYPRTDSNYLTHDMVETIQERLRAILATDYKSHVRDLMSETFSSKMHIFNNQKVSDHHAIIPTEVRPSIEQLSQREFKIYMLIAERFLENLMNPYLYEVLTIHAQLKGYHFVLKEKIPKQLGYKALKDQPSSNTLTHSFKEGQLFNVHRIEIHEHETKAPEYFNEGSLLKAMENPQNHIDLNDKKYAKTLKHTGGLEL